jgi:hypothetical protein
MKSAEEEVAGNEEDGEEIESEERLLLVLPVRKTQLQKQKEEETAKESAEGATSSEGLSSGDVVELTPSKVKRKQSPSQAEVKAKEELRSKRKHDRPVQTGLFRYLKPEMEKPAPVGHPALRTLPVAK